MFLSRASVIAATAVAAFTFGSLAPLPASAQAAGAPQTSPATEKDVNVYSMMGAINICVLSANQVPLSKSMPATLDMIVTTLTSLHGGVIQGANDNKKLDTNQLANGTLINVVPRVKSICYDKLVAADKKSIDDTMAQIQKALKGGGK
ncbi:MAG: hypothetical protein VKK62_03500 [Synechococcaceae cyanobacterium]|nr:hypothetical protein [Synechococcaceae cyanobacterium]